MPELLQAPDHLFDQVVVDEFMVDVDHRLGSGIKDLEIDLSSCKALSAYGVNQLLQAVSRAKESGGSVKISNASRELKELLGLIFLDNLV
jgi:ABC-type transporter Mla MlaB component